MDLMDILLHYNVYIYIYINKIVHYGVDANTEWEYSSKYEPGWYKNSFTGRWSTSKISNINANGNTLYLRKIIQIHDINSISAFYTRIDVLSGFVYYANETEVGRINLPQYIYSILIYLII